MLFLDIKIRDNVSQCGNADFVKSFAKVVNVFEIAKLF